jgi:hypothetical protein
MELRVQNPNTGTAALSQISFLTDDATGSGGRGGLAVFNSTYTTTGNYRASGTYLYNNGGGGVTVAAENGVANVYIVAGNSERMRILSNGRVGIGTTSPLAPFHVYQTSGGTAITSLLIGDTAGYANNKTPLSILLSGLASTESITIQLGKTSSTSSTFLGYSYNGGGASDYFWIAGYGYSIGSGLNVFNDGRVGIGTTSPSAKLDVRGTANITNTSPYACPNNDMQAGSLTIGDTLLNYGGGSLWNANTAGFLMECLTNTEFAIHDAGDRIASFMYYSGNRYTIGRDMGWGAITSTNFLGSVGINGVATPTKPLVVNRVSGGGTNNPAIMIGNNGIGTGLRFQTYDLTQQADAYMGLGTDMGGNSFEHCLVFSAPTTPGYVGAGRQTFGAYDGTTYTTMMTILGNGNVGIGRSDPGSRLSITPAGGIANKILTLYDGNPADPVASATNFYGFGINSGTLRYQVDAAGNSHLFYSGATAYFRINSSGGVNVSDRRYKSEIVPISNALATIQQLQGITFKMQDLEKRQMGFIAQDVAKVIPEVVTMDENTQIYYMSYDKLTAVLCEGIKELASENAVLKARLDAIEKLLQSDSSA